MRTGVPQSVYGKLTIQLSHRALRYGDRAHHSWPSNCRCSINRINSHTRRLYS